jgi:predicted aspartyl protease
MTLPFLALRQGTLRRPQFLVEIHHPPTGKMLKTWGLIDTGADECVLPASFAEILGIELDKGMAMATGTAGGVANRYMHRVSLRTDGKLQGIRFPDAEIGFMDGLNAALLGVKTFLAFFTLIIECERETFTLTPNSKGRSLATA